MSGARILIVEDEALVAKDLSAALGDMGYRVIGTVGTGEEAVFVATGERPDLVLMDIVLRGPMDGIEAAGEINRLTRIPVVFLTGYSEREIIGRAKITEPYGYLLKPFNMQEVAATIEMALFKARVEAKLIESEERFRRAFESATIGMVIIGLDGRFIEVNSAFCHLLGYSEPQLLQMTFLDITHPDDVERSRRAIESILDGSDEYVQLEKRYVHQNGGTIWAWVSSALCRDSAGRPVHFIGQIQDVTRRKQAEDLMAIERDLGLALSSTTSLNEALGLCLEASFKIDEIDCGGIYFFDEATGGLVLSHHDGLGDEFVAWASRIPLGSGRANLVLAGKPVYQADTMMPGEDAKLREAEGLYGLAVIPLWYDNRVIGSLNVASRIHDRIPPAGRRALEAIASIIGGSLARINTSQSLIESERRFRGLIDIMTEGLVMFDRHMRVSYINQKCLDILAVTWDQVVGRDAIGLFEEFADEKTKKTLVAKALARMRGDEEAYELEGRRADGRMIWVRVSPKIVWGADGSFKGSLSVVSDVTERKRAEEELIASQRELRARADELEGLNTALRVLLEFRDDEKQKLEEGILDNLRMMVEPYIERLKQSPLSPDQEVYLGIIEDNLGKIASPLASKLTSDLARLTPAELRVAGLIRDGRSSKEIAQILGVSSTTVTFHRANIREKLNLKNRKGNLRSHLQLLEQS